MLLLRPRHWRRGGQRLPRAANHQPGWRPPRAPIHDASLIDGILPLAEGIGEHLKAGIDVCEVGCGQGHAVNLIAQAFPQSRVTGSDFSEEGIAAATLEAVRLGLINATFAVQDVAEVGESDRFDLITAFDTIHHQADPAKVLRN